MILERNNTIHNTGSNQKLDLYIYKLYMCRFKGRGEWVAAMQNWVDSFDNRYIILDINY